jgi:hypothetical protein
VHEIPSARGSFPFIYFLHAFDKEKRHIILVLMSNPRFKMMWLVTSYVDRERTSIMDVEYDEQLLLPLVMECYNLMMFNIVISRKWCKASMWTMKIFFTQWRQTLTIGNNLFQKILMDFNGILRMCKTTNVLWWCTKECKFLIIAIFLAFQPAKWK